MQALYFHEIRNTLIKIREFKKTQNVNTSQTFDRVYQTVMNTENHHMDNIPDILLDLVKSESASENTFLAIFHCINRVLTSNYS